MGMLDQGFWPDGLYTAPTDAALAYDIQLTKQIGMNMLRKHVKVRTLALPSSPIASVSCLTV